MIHGGATSEERRAELIEEARHLAATPASHIRRSTKWLRRRGPDLYTTRAVSGTSLRGILDELERGKTSSLLHFGLRRLLSIFHRVCDAVATRTPAEDRAWRPKTGARRPRRIREIFVTGCISRATADEDGQPLPAFNHAKHRRPRANSLRG